MSVKELMAAFKASRGSLSAKPLHRLPAPAWHDMRTAEELAHETKTDTVNETAVESQKAVYGAESLTGMVDEVAAPAKRTRVRKPTACKCSCNSDAPTARVCGGLAGCGHKGCRFAL